MPHVANELWALSKFKDLDINFIWPKFKKEIIEKDQIIIAVQINGKTRGSILLEFESENVEQLTERIVNENKFKNFLENKKIFKKIYIEKRLINLIVK